MSEENEVITGIEVPIFLKYNFTAGASPTRFLARVKEGVADWAALPEV